jgi:hypothetical protein
MESFGTDKLQVELKWRIRNQSTLVLPEVPIDLFEKQFHQEYLETGKVQNIGRPPHL